MESGCHFMKFSSKDFCNNVRDKFKKVIPEDSFTLPELEDALEKLDMESTVRNITSDIKIDRRSAIGCSNLIFADCVPAAAASTPNSHKELPDMSSGSPAELNLDKKYIETVVNDYHKNLRKLLQLLEDDRSILDGKSGQPATAEEFAQTMDKESISVMKQRKDQPEPNAVPGPDQLLDKKIELCFKVFVARLWVQSFSMSFEYDMTEEAGRNGYADSFAVYYLTLQLLRKKVCGTFYIIIIIQKQTPATMKSGCQYMKFSSKEFCDNIKDKFQNVIPENLFTLQELEIAMQELKMESTLPNITSDLSIDKRCTIGLSNLEFAECTPADAETSTKSHKKLQDMSSGSRDAPAKLGIDKQYIKFVVDGYHEHQYKLFELLKIPCNKEGRLLVDNRERPAYTDEFAQAIDELSISAMIKRMNQSEPTSVPEPDEFQETIIKLCFKVFVARLWVHSYSMNFENDFMTEGGWKVWREHAWAVGSFAVYYLTLQLQRKKRCGTFYIIHQKTPRKKRQPCVLM